MEDDDEPIPCPFCGQSFDVANLVAHCLQCQKENEAAASSLLVPSHAQKSNDNTNHNNSSNSSNSSTNTTAASTLTGKRKADQLSSESNTSYQSPSSITTALSNADGGINFHNRKVMILMRGPSGSGKSYYAKLLHLKFSERSGQQGVILSTDDFFVNRHTGAYEFDIRRLGEAHTWNIQRAAFELSRGTSPVIVDNTNLQRWEAHRYYTHAARCGYAVHVAESRAPWRYDAAELARRCTHDVPHETIEMQLDRWEKYTVADLAAFVPRPPK